MEYTKKMLDEKFASKAQQRFFYAQAGKKGKKGKKWAKWAKEFSDDTDFEKLPEKVNKKEVDEIVDAAGNIKRGKKPANFNKVGVTQRAGLTTDRFARMSGGQIGRYGIAGGPYMKYWSEGKEISKKELLEIAMEDALGFDETMGANEPYDDAEKIMTKELGLSDEDANDRLENMGYDPDLPDGQVRLVEKNSLEEFIESILSQKTQQTDLVSNSNEIKEINDIVKKQLKSLKETMKNHNLSVNDILEYLKDNE